MSRILNELISNTEGLLGLSLYLVPSYIFTPPLFVASEIALCAVGASLVTVLIFRLFLCKTSQQETLLAEIRMLCTTLTLPLILKNAITGTTGGGFVNPNTLYAMFGFQIVSLMVQIKQIKTWVQPSAIIKMSGGAWEFLLFCLYGFPLSLGLLIFPDYVASYFYHFNPPLELVKLDPFMRLCLSLEGAYLAAFGIIGLGEVKNLPKSCLCLGRLLFSLFAVIYLRAFADDSPYVNKQFFQTSFALHVGILTAASYQEPWWSSLSFLDDVDEDEKALDEQQQERRKTEPVYHMPLTPISKRKTLPDSNVVIPNLAFEDEKKKTPLLFPRRADSDIDYLGPLTTAQDPHLY